MTAVISVYQCSASFLFVPSAVWSVITRVYKGPCSVLLLTNQTSQCHRAALSKTHGHVSSLHSPAFQCLAGSPFAQRLVQESYGLSSDRIFTKINELTIKAYIFPTLPHY